MEQVSEQTDKALIARLEQRAAALSEIRAFFAEAGFLEVQTPILLSTPGQETHIRPFQTEYDDPEAGTRRCYLVTSPEHHMKRLLGHGCQRIFQIGSCFRDGESSSMHLPEFTMVEWYRTGAGYLEVADDLENMIRRLSRKVFEGTRISTACGAVDIAAQWQHLSVSKAFMDYAGIDPVDYPETDPEGFRRAALEQCGVIIGKTDSWEDVFFKLMIERVEPALAALPHAVFLQDYPAGLAALARLHPPDYRVAQRLELYIGGIELANGFSELTDGREQRRRFMAQRAARRGLGASTLPLDEAFLRMLSDGRMPMAGGMALGLDRLIAVLSGIDDIHQTRAFSMDRDTT
jgi:lysyl-tRNA synthetase class 2